MMDTSTPRGFYQQYHGQLIRLVFKDGGEWVGMVSGFDATAVVFTRIRWLKGYYKKVPFFRGWKRRLPIDKLAEIHKLPLPVWARSY